MNLSDLLDTITQKQSELGPAATLEDSLFALCEDCIRVHLHIGVFYDLPQEAIGVIRIWHGARRRRQKSTAARQAITQVEFRRAEIVRRVLPSLIRPIGRGAGSSPALVWKVLLLLASGMRATECKNALERGILMTALIAGTRPDRIKSETGLSGHRNQVHALRRDALRDIATQLRPLMVDHAA